MQQHKHSSYCKKSRSCRSQSPSPKTLIAYSNDEEDVLNSCSKNLSKVRKQLLVDGNIDVTIEQLLNNVRVPLSQYMKALETSSNGNAIILRRNPNECKINNYNPHVRLAWQANMDIQYVLNAYSCVMMKSERATQVT